MRITPETSHQDMLDLIREKVWPALYKSESEFQKGVESYLQNLGWSYFHDRDSRQNREGFPDLTAWRGERLIFAELKLGPRSSLSLGQVYTLITLAQTPAEVYLWLPWEDEILEVLSRV